ncbi:MAG: hypothetical protein ACI9MC_000168 [Kiritimatiellia bacterium]
MVIAEQLLVGQTPPLKGWCFRGESLERVVAMVRDDAPALRRMCGCLNVDPSTVADRVSLPWQHAELLDGAEQVETDPLTAPVVDVLDFGERLRELERHAWADQTHRAQTRRRCGPNVVDVGVGVGVEGACERLFG